MKENETNIRVCRVSMTYPTKQRPGVGRHAYHTSNIMKYPVLVLTKHAEQNYFEPDKHVNLTAIKYPHKRFKPRIWKNVLHNIKCVMIYGFGQILFLIKSMKHLNDFRPTIVHLQSPHSFLIGLYCKIKWKSKVVLTFHGGDYYSVKNSTLWKRILSFSDEICAISESHLPTLKKMFPHCECVNTPSAVDVSIFNDLKLTREKIIVTVGHLAVKKGHTCLIQAFKIVHEKLPEYKLIIIGEDGGEKEIIENMISQENLNESVILTGTLSANEIKQYLNHAKLFVLSSIREGLPKALLEALACGLPAVVTDVGSNKTVVENCGLWVASQQPEKLAESIIHMIQDTNFYAACQLNTTSKARLYTWETLSERLNNVFCKLQNE